MHGANDLGCLNMMLMPLRPTMVKHGGSPQQRS
jgi:hypothetical protein